MSRVTADLGSRSRRLAFIVGVAALAISCGARSELEVPGVGAGAGGGGGGGKSVSPNCGNALVDPGEECDDGNKDDTDACLSNCKKARCGDGVRSTHEACDDGNTVDDDQCRNDCSLPTCGDGVVESGEQCDSPDPTQCTPLCLLPACGDGFLDPAKEACDRGPSNEDRPAIRLIHDDLTEPVIPIRGAQGDVAFYDYQSASAHTGFEALHTSNLFLRQTNGLAGLSLYTIHGIDLDSSGQAEGSGQVTQSFQGLPGASFIAVADEPSELHLTSPGQASGVWKFQDNTDGGVIGGIAFPGSWTIVVDSTFIEAITAWRYDDLAKGAIGLGSNQAVLQALDTPSLCRTDCTIPRCGDGVLDGGEVCDDGNQVSGDGCSADCKQTN